MTYAPSGAVVAAPTTSLPGEARRRTATGTIATAGCAMPRSRCARSSPSATTRRPSAFWAGCCTPRASPGRGCRCVYDVFGEAHLPERELPHLAGYAGSRPVRIGNDAHGQLQLDVYGEVLDAVARSSRRGGRLDRDTARLLDGLGPHRLPALARARRGHLGRARRAASTTPTRRCCAGSRSTGCWRCTSRPDCRLPPTGSAPSATRSGPRSRRTDTTRGLAELYPHLRRRDAGCQPAHPAAVWLHRRDAPAHARRPARGSTSASGRDGLVHRYAADTDDGLPPGEGAFGICSFWAVECQARGGRPAGARRRRSSGCSATPTTWACSRRRSTRTPARRWGTFPRRSRTSA